jgi:type I restriction enzyme S subunit
MPKSISFQETKAGYIPSDWVSNQILKVSSLVTNGFVGTATPHYTELDNGVIYMSCPQF